MLDIAGEKVYATYKEGTGTTSLLFSYTVSTTKTDNNGVLINGLIEGIIRDFSGNVLIPEFLVENNLNKVFINGRSTVLLDKITIGDGHSCALKNNGKVLCWGNGNYGQLGNGSNDSNDHPVTVLEVDSDAELSNIVRLVLEVIILVH